MLKPSQISAKISELRHGRLSLDDFEQWFRRASRNFHVYADEQAKEAIFAIEAVLSEYHFAGMSEESTSVGLAAAIRPFVEAESVNHAASAIRWQRNRASNISQDQTGTPMAANNADVAFNSFAA